MFLGGLAPTLDILAHTLFQQRIFMLILHEII